MKPELVLDCRAELAEGPSWDSRNGVLYWVDIPRGLVHAFDPANARDVTVGGGEYVSCVVPRKARGLAVTLRDGFYSIDPRTGKVSVLAKVEKKNSGNRFNDGKCDPAGRFWAGTMDLSEKRPSGALYCLTREGKTRKVVGGVTISNGLGWSPDGGTMYYIDSPTKRVTAFDFKMKTGEIGRSRTAVSLDGEPGVPDGMAVDEEGMIWVAQWGGWRVTRFNPGTGKALEGYSIPVEQVSSCCFGGMGLRELYITTAREGLNPSQVSKQPHAGSLFRLDAGVKGLPTYAFDG